MDGQPRRVAPPPVIWGETMCYRRSCIEAAVLTIDGWPWCLRCGDDEIERWIAFEIAPDAVRESFPTLEDR